MRGRRRIPLAALTALLIPLLSPSNADAQVRLLGISVGADSVKEFSDDDIDRERVGLQAAVPVFGVLEFAPAIGYLTSFPNVSGFSGSAWQLFLTARVRPPGPASFFSVGYGVSALRLSQKELVTGISDSMTGWTDVAVVGIEFPGGLLRPFADVYLVDILDHDSDLDGVLLVGFNLGI